MRISLIGPVYPYRGGIAHYTANLALALKRIGHEVKVISFKRQYPAFLYPGETDKDLSSNPIRVDADFLLDPLYPWTWLQTARKILDSKPDLVLFQWWTTFWGPAFTGLSFKLRNRVTTAYLIHNVLPHESRFWDRLLVRMTLSQASDFIVQAKREQQRLLNFFPNARISYCGHPIYQRFNEQSIPKDVARRQLGLPIDESIFLFFGIVRPYKGLKFLIDAITRTELPIHLIVAGEFWENEAAYNEQIAALGLNKRITLINRYISNEEAHIIFSSADALVAPYVGGTQSGVAELALGYGLPIVITDRISEGITDTKVPMKIVPVGNVDLLAAAMDEFVKRPPNFPAIESIDNSWKRMVETIERMYSQVL